MGKPRAKTPASLPVTLQAKILQRRYPRSRVVRRRTTLNWRGELSPTTYSDTYEVVLDHTLGRKPLVYVARPRLALVASKPLPHVFSWNTLCLYLNKHEWHPGLSIADTLVPWASEWLLFYEIWLATDGEWLGEGVHPRLSSATETPKARARAERERDAKFQRLVSALRAAYGNDADVDELLYNARLKRRPDDGDR